MDDNNDLRKKYAAKQQKSYAGGGDYSASWQEKCIENTMKSYASGADGLRGYTKPISQKDDKENSR
jgi:hypothetical protein